MATNFELQAIITALDNASKVFGKVGSSAKKSGSSIKSAFKGAGSAFGSVRKGVKGVDTSLQKIGQQIPAVQAAFGALKGAMDLGRLGASFERVEERFGKFAAAAGGSEAIFDAFQAGVGGTASKMDTMAISSGLLQAGLVGSASEMERVTEVASRLGDQTIGTADRIGAFSQLLKNQSIQLLDNFGISSGKVRERIGELQAETKGLSREQAFLTATFEQADAALAVLGPRTEDSLTKFEKMDAQMADLRVEIGQKLAPAMSDLMGAFSAGIGIVSSMIDVFVGLGDKVSELATSVPVVGEALEAAFSALDVDAAAKTAEQLAVLSDSAKVGEGTISEWGTAAADMMSTGSSLSEVMQELGERTKETSKAFDRGRGLADIFVDQTGILSDASKKAGDVALDAAKSYDEYETSIATFNAVVPDATAKISAMSQAQFDMTKRTREGASANSLLADSILQAKVATEGEAERIGAASTARDLHNQGLYDSADATEAATAKASELVSARQRANDAVAQSASLEAMAADSARRLGEAQVAAAAQTAAFAAEQGNLMTQLSGATKAQFKQAVFAEIDPAAIGVEAYAALGQELGVLDGKAADLAAAVPLLTQAYADGIVPTENMAAATTALFEAAGTAGFNTGALLDQFAKAPGLIGPSRDELELLNEKLALTGEASMSAESSVTGFGDSVTTVATNTSVAGTAVDDLTASLTALTLQPWVVDVSVNQPSSAGAGGIPSFQTGGVMPYTGLANLHAGEIVLPPGQGTVTKNYSLTINTAAPIEPIMQDFATLEAMG